MKTLSMFVAQALSADGSCREVVDEAMVGRVLEGLKPGSTDTGGYCKARARLALAMISTLARQTGGILTEGAAWWWQWRGRPVRLVEGTTVTLPDTEANQAAYPQSSSQKAGLGFPICRVVGLLCLGSGALLGAAMGPCEGKGSDEQSLLGELLDNLQEGDILLGDALYPSYFLLWELIRGGVDGLFEQHGARRRSTDFSQGEKLGVRDHLIVLTKPKQRPDWRSPYEYDQAPDALTVREFQADGKILVTTLSVFQADPQSGAQGPVWPTLERGAGSAPPQDDPWHGAAALPDSAEGYQRVVGVPARLQPHSALDDAGRPAGRSDSTPAQLQAHRADLDRLAATRKWQSRCGYHQRLTDFDCRAASRLTTTGAARTARPKAQAETVSFAHRPRQEVREEVRKNGHPKK